MKKKTSGKYLWIAEEGQNYRLGLTNDGQDELGSITFVSLPKVGSTLIKDEAFADVEAEKAVTELLSPLNGKVLEVNEKAVDEPSLLDSEDEAEAWLLVISEVTDEDFQAL
ncbi:glycine cleavage system protein H [Vagococcus elongatus]|uniref:Lipoyl-binding domain-containing protein n=1 Tax=Vagococcus elongatus TaxID=180344 RepID=A0A430AQN7_9ENTE|nr:glycine cleavage system protein H [Vagococcus elongatus]RSU10293.1 hypothetical protein CBF29_09780 [Vagococcus elongatus]